MPARDARRCAPAPIHPGGADRARDGRQVRTEESLCYWWDTMRLELPEGTPDRVYLRLAVYEAPSRAHSKPKLVATTGVTVQQLRERGLGHGDARGRGVPLELRTLSAAGRACGTLWMERCELLGFDVDEDHEHAPSAEEPW